MLKGGTLITGVDQAEMLFRWTGGLHVLTSLFLFGRLNHVLDRTTGAARLCSAQRLPQPASIALWDVRLRRRGSRAAAQPTCT